MWTVSSVLFLELGLNMFVAHTTLFLHSSGGFRPRGGLSVRLDQLTFCHVDRECFAHHLFHILVLIYLQYFFL